MALKFKDYYETLGVSRTASADEIQRAFRKLARQFHPDVNKSADADVKFKEINEAYEVLKDPEKRKRYDTLGANWRQGQEWSPPPGWEGGGFDGTQFDFGGGAGASDFSDFFNTLFGNLGGRAGRAGPGGFGGFTQARGPRRRRGQDAEVDVELTLEEVAAGGKKPIVLHVQELDENGRPAVREQRYDVTIPPGISEGSRIRLAGQGGPGVAGGEAGDLHLRVHLAPHPRFAVDGHDLRTLVLVAPWEAVLGGEVSLPTLTGSMVKLKVPAGSQAGQTLRLRGLGLPIDKERKGDLLATIRVAVPSQADDRQRELWQQLAAEVGWSPPERSQRP